MIRIGIAGAPGTGKTTLSRSLTNELSKLGANAQYVSEFARDHINLIKTKNGDCYVPTLTDQVIFFEKQLERETLFPPNVQYVITDSPVFLSLVYTLMNCDLGDAQQRAFYYHMYDKVIETIFEVWTAYDFVFFLDNSKPYRLDGTRNENEEVRNEISRRIQGFLDFHGLKYFILPSSNEDRIIECLKIIRTRPESGI